MKKLIYISIALLIFSCNPDPYGRQQYNFDENMKLVDSVIIMQDKFINKASKCEYFFIKTRNTKYKDTSRMYLDSVTKYIQFSRYILSHIKIPQ